MRKEVVFNIKNNSYTEDMYYFQTEKKKPININDVNIENIVLSKKTLYGKRVVTNIILHI